MKGEIWAKEEIEFLRNNYSIMKNEELSKNLNHSISSIITKANHHFNLKKLKTCKYCRINIDNLANNAIVCNNCRIEHIKNRKKEDYIKNRKKLINKKSWTKEELEYLKQNYPLKKNDELEQYLSHSVNSIITKANNYLKLKKLRLCKSCRVDITNLVHNAVTCNTCRIEYKKQYKKEWHMKNREKNLKRYNKWKINNPEHKKELDKIWRVKNAERKRNNDRIYHEKLRKIENERRTKLGLPLIGNYYQKEKELLLYIKNLFPNMKIISHDRKVLGNRLELDIFIPELNLAFEYQGEHHFDPNNHFYFKNQEDFHALQKRDHLKKDLCKKNDIVLIEFYYHERLDEQFVLKKLFENGIFNNQSRLVGYSLKINEIKRETKEVSKWETDQLKNLEAGI